MKQSEKFTQLIIGGVVTIAIIAVVVAFFIQSSDGKKNITELPTKNNNSQQAEAKESVEFSVDNPDEPYRTLSLDEVDELISSKRKQMLLISCRYCPYCQEFEQTLKEFAKKHNLSRDSFQKWEAGYLCTHDKNSKDYSKYQTLSSKLIDRGVPQFLYIDQGEIVDKIESNRSIQDLETFFEDNNYPLN